MPHLLVACLAHVLVHGSFSAVPRVVPLTLAESASVIYEWSRGVETRTDRVRELEAARRMYQARSVLGTLGSVGVVCEGCVQSVALLERVDDDDRIVLWNVCTAPTTRGGDAGSALLRALTLAQPNMTLGRTLHPRWRIAHNFYVSE